MLKYRIGDTYHRGDKMALLKDLIVEITKRNHEGKELPLLGVNKDKEFMPSVANVIGTDLSNYKIVKKRQFATNLMHVDRDEMVPVSMLEDYDEALISPAYNVFQVKDEKIVIPEYLLLCFKRSEFDRCAWFYSGSSIRGNLDYKKFLEIDIPLPDIDKQKKIIDDYKAIQKEIRIKEVINNNLFEQLSLLYRNKLLKGLSLKNIESLSLPEEFKIDKIGKYCSVKSGYAFKSDWWNQTDGKKVIKIGNITQNSIDLKECDLVPDKHLMKASMFAVSNYDMLIALTGATIGKIGFIPECDEILYVNQRVGKFFFDSDSINKIPFIYCTLMQQEYLSKIISKSEASSAQANMSGDDIENLQIIYPNSNEIEAFNDYAGIIFKTIGKNIAIINNLLELKAYILSNIAKQ